MKQEHAMKWLGLVVWVTVLAGAAPALAKQDDPELKRDAVSRLSKSHDASLSTHIGRVYVKQAALKEARDLLGERGKAAGLRNTQWNMDTAEWISAEKELMQGVDQLIHDRVADSSWVIEAWSELAARSLNAEEADEIAVHFESEGGSLQRQVIEWFVGELTLQTYTFTDRLRYGVRGSEQEMHDLQVVTYERKERFPPIYDLTKYPDAMRFASVDPGIRYMKKMVIEGVHALHVHLEAAANQARAMIRARSGLVDPYLDRVRAGG
jgi:hypothetical protein